MSRCRAQSEWTLLCKSSFKNGVMRDSGKGFLRKSQVWRGPRRGKMECDAGLKLTESEQKQCSAAKSKTIERAEREGYILFKKGRVTRDAIFERALRLMGKQREEGGARVRSRAFKLYVVLIVVLSCAPYCVL